MYDAVNSRYTYKNSDVLKNKLDIRDEETLKEYEKRIVAVKLVSIIKIVKDNFGNKFDERRLKFIHMHLFSEVYDFAGQYRLENITKDNLEKLRNMSFDELVEFISSLMTDLNVLHPFREGNGRATREFVRELLEELGYEINFFDIDYDKILAASKLAVIDETAQIFLLKSAIKKKKQ